MFILIRTIFWQIYQMMGNHASINHCPLNSNRNSLKLFMVISNVLSPYSSSFTPWAPSSCDHRHAPKLAPKDPPLNGMILFNR